MVLYILKRSMEKAKRKDQSGNSEEVEDVLFRATWMHWIAIGGESGNFDEVTTVLELFTVYEISKLISHRCMQQADWHNDPALGGWNRQKPKQQTPWCVRTLL